MIINSSNRPPADVYDNVESFDAYITEVRDNRAEFTRRRELEAFWIHAVTVLTREIELSQEVGDTQTRDELEQLRAGYQERLVLQRLNGKVDRAEALIATPANATELPTNESAALAPIPFETIEDHEVIGTNEVRQAYEAALGSRFEVPDGTETDASSVSRNGAESTPHLTREEKKQKTDELLRAMGSVKVRLMELSRTSQCGSQMGSKLLLQLRPIGCAVEGVWADAIATGVEGALERTVESLRDSIDAVRLEWRDTGTSTSFDVGIRSGKKRAVGAVAWNELEKRFAMASDASDALDWVMERWSELDASTLEPLLNSIGAVSQLLRRAIAPYGVWDAVQTDMFNNITSTTKDASVYLVALNKDTPTLQLEEFAAQFDESRSAAESEYEDKAELRQKEEARRTAHEVFDALCVERPDLGAVKDRFIEDQARLFCVLDQMHQAGIPHSNKKVREYLLANGPALLAEEPRFIKILRGIQDERVRCGLDAPTHLTDTAESDEDDTPLVPMELAEVREWLLGKRVMILGGVPKPETCAKLKQSLGCGTVNWPKSCDSDTASRFRSAIEICYVLMVVTNYAGHDYSEKGKEWIESKGGHFLKLRDSCGVTQIIHRLYLHSGRRLRQSVSQQP